MNRFFPPADEFCNFCDAAGSVLDSQHYIHPCQTGRAFILTWPTIFHIKDGVWRNYGRGPRKTRDLQYFIEKKQWKRFEPYFWFDPGKDIYPMYYKH
jgi:hypothetical protein